ncbi:prepilin-type N-terminal cleavage/methylation domain-containing protein [Synechococcus sp. PCC 6717]|nr:prepilin-type N-terminal cleavage/methylation domain-containing protein [Synechococcus sp. PCC 6717]
MPFSVVRRVPQGLTLIEILIVMAVAAVLATVAAPSFQYWLQTQQVNQELEKLEGALREAQREAMRRNQACEVVIPEGNNPTITGDPAACLPTGPRQLENVTLRRSNTMGTVRFGFQGRSGADGVAVISLNQVPSLQRCLQISPGLGLMRTGVYAESDTSGTNPENCRER